ncbi:MAG: glycosyl hydrolase [Candidatus Hodarchaeota archaeon]
MKKFLEEFKLPPKTSRPLVRWWWPGLDVEEDELLNELKELDEKGFGGAEVQAFLIGTPDPNTEKKHRFAPHPFFYDTIEFLLKEAKKRGLTIDLTIASSWPPGGTWVKTEDSLHTMIMGVEIVKGPKPIQMQAPPYKLNAYYKYPKLLAFMGEKTKFFEDDFKLIATVAVQPIKKSKKIKFFRPRRTPLKQNTAVDISDHVDDSGQLNWEVPEGTWQIFTFYAGPCGMAPKSEAKSDPDLTGLVVDLFNEGRVAKFLDDEYNPGMNKLGPYMGNTLRAFFTDSQEICCEWFITDDFFDEFRKRRGYDVRPYLPACFVPNRDNQSLHLFLQNFRSCFDFPDGTGDRIRHDWEQTISDLFAERFCAGVSNWGKKHGGVQHRIQTYGIRVDLLKAYGHADIPETEQLYAGGLLDFLRFAGSAAVIYDKPIVTSESLVWMAADYKTTPLKWKVAADRLFVSGVNQMIYHGFPYGPEVPWKEFPGHYPWSPPTFSSNLNHHNPFWKFFEKINGYVARGQHVMQEGKTACNVAIYFPFFNYDTKYLKEEDLGAGYLEGFDGDSIGGIVKWFLTRVNSKYDKLTLAHQLIADQITEHGYYYTHINEEMLLKGEIKDGVLHAGKAKIEALVLPNISRISLPLAEKLQDIVSKGIKVIFTGCLPDGQPGFHEHEKNDAKIKDIIKALHNDGLQFIESNVDVGEYLLNTLEVPPCVKFLQPEKNIQFIQKRIGGDDVYFIRSGRPTASELVVTFPQKVKLPYILDMWTGETKLMWHKYKDDEYPMVKLKLAPYDSRMILFHAGLEAEPDQKIKDRVELIEKEELVNIQQPPPIPINSWDLKVAKRLMNGEVEYIEMRMNKLKDWREVKKLKTCSGPGTYKATFNLSKGYFIAGIRMFLNLGRVQDVATVKINGHVLDPILVTPYEVEITDHVKVLDNELEIEVIGTLRNCLMGYGKAGGKAWKHHKRRKRWMAMGLIGPVLIEPRKIG